VTRSEGLNNFPHSDADSTPALAPFPPGNKNFVCQSTPFVGLKGRGQLLAECGHPSGTPKNAKKIKTSSATLPLAHIVRFAKALSPFGLLSKGGTKGGIRG